MGVVIKTLQDIKAFDKPVLTIFNKMDVYEKNTFDEWLDDSVKQEMLLDLNERWQLATENNAVFVSATERRNIDELRETILKKVRTLYEKQYPYLTDFY
jgi:GTP-binding protein HflX